MLFVFQSCAVEDLWSMLFRQRNLFVITYITGWWFGTCFIFSIHWECHNPNWRSHIFQRGRSTTNQIMYLYVHIWPILQISVITSHVLPRVSQGVVFPPKSWMEVSRCVWAKWRGMAWRNASCSWWLCWGGLILFSKLKIRVIYPISLTKSGEKKHVTHKKWWFIPISLTKSGDKKPWCFTI